MTAIKRKFYNIFWDNQSCQNIFLLSKEELLDSHTLNISEKPIQYSFPRIIISNVDKEKGNIHETIKYRTENQNLEIEGTMEVKLEVVEPLIVELFEKKLKKPFEKIVADIEEKPVKFFFQIMKLLTDENKFEERAIDLLKQYNIIGYNINSFNEIKGFFENEFLSKKNQLVTEDNIHLINHFLNFLKTYYINYSKKRLYETNQVLVNAIDNKDNLGARINLFHLLYEAKIISNSSEDAHVECVNCEVGEYRGIINIKINPNKLENLKCPICSSKLNYFVPYELNNEIYQIVKEKDGLILNALCDKLDRMELDYKLNERYINDIEIDCLVFIKNNAFMIECKMYKLKTDTSRLISKLKKHSCKLSIDAIRVKEENKINNDITPLLLVNINDEELLKSIEDELNLGATSKCPIKIVNITTVDTILKNEISNSMLKLPQKL